MSTTSYEVKAKFIRGFSDKTRLQILETLQHAEKTVSEIVAALQGNQSNISQHLACLKGCGIIVCRQEGKYMYYSLRSNQIVQLLEAMDTVFTQIVEDVAACDKNEEWDCCTNR